MADRYLRSAPGLLGAASFVTIITGFTLLWHGGTSLAATLLTLGYTVGIPGALLLAARQRGAAADPPPYRAAMVLFVVILALYAATLAPTTAMWDTSEYIAAAKTLGIPHPPGNPGFVLLAHTFALLPIPVSYAARINLLAATTSAASAALWFLVAWRSLRGWGMAPWARIVTALAAAWIGATSFTVWNQSVVNEKVYTVAMLGLALVTWLALQWRDAQEESAQVRAGSSVRGTALLWCIAYLCGVGYTNHPAGFLPLPALGLFVLWQRPSLLLRWKTLVGAAGFLMLGLTPFLYEPIRAAYRPIINVGEPTACAGAPALGCTFSADTFAKLMSNVNREQYGGHEVSERRAPLGAQFGMWWLYFSWQTMRDAPQAHAGAQTTLAVLFLAFGLLGGVTHWHRDRRSFAFIGPLIFTLTPALVVYLNFRYGASQALDLGDSVAREPRDRDYFYLWSFATWGVWVGLGLGALWQMAATWAARVAGHAPRSWVLTSGVMAVALLPLLLNRHDAPRRKETFTREWAVDLLESVEPNGILITNGDNDSFPAWYAQLVEEVRPDVTVAIVPYLSMDWFAKRLVKNPASIPPMIQLEQAAAFEHAGIRATVPAGLYTRDQLMVLQLIKEQFPARPIHFSIGGYANSLGLRDYTVSVGLTSKLVATPALQNPAYVDTPQGAMDPVTADSLWRRMQGPAAMLQQDRWVDAPSLSIPYAYLVTGQYVGQWRAQRGATAAADSLGRELQAMAKVAGVGLR
jgi:hypothetical protein